LPISAIMGKLSFWVSYSYPPFCQLQFELQNARWRLGVKPKL